MTDIISTDPAEDTSHKVEHADILKSAQENLELGLTWESTARQRFIQDLRFAEADSENGYQWPDKYKKERQLNDRPCLTINKVRQHNLLIINDAKQNKPGIAVRPTGNEATYEAAQVWAAIMRKIEYQSAAQEVYDQATGFQVKAGVGYWRVVTRYIDAESFDQDAYIEGIADPLTVVIDNFAKKPDKSDMQWAIIFEDIKKEQAQAKYGKMVNLSGTTLGMGLGLNQQDSVRIAEYYWIEETEDTLWRIQDNSNPDKPQEYIILESLLDKELIDHYKNDEMTETRPVKTKKVRWVFFIGSELVEEKEWLGSEIPVIQLLGEECVVDGVMDRKGHTRALIDPQRMYNYWSPLSLDTPLPTPDGWTTMGFVQSGDWLLDEKGRPVQVVGTSPIHLHRECYRVTFDDGSFIIADGEHKWTVEERGKRISAGWKWSTRTITTVELRAHKHFIYTTEALDLPQIELPIDPYILGVWLGDGYTSEPRISSGVKDAQEMYNLLQNRGCCVGLPITFASNQAGATISLYGARPLFSNLGLLGNKHIPAQYLRASKEQRLELLRGLMDTDGSFVLGTHQCSFTTTNDRIAEGFGELLQSLGIKAVSCDRKAQSRKFPSGNTYDCLSSVQFSFTVEPSVGIFRLKRKLEAQTKPRKTHARRTKRHGIESIVPVTSVPVKCVTINSKSHLFLAGSGMVPTHNSSAVEYGALQTKTPWLAAAEALDGYTDDWAEANVQNKAVLQFNALSENGEAIPPPERIAPPMSAPVALDGLKIAQMEMMLVSGQYEAQFGQESNERSGKAINERQRQGDRATYHFIDNLGIAIRRTGKILLEIIPKLYNTKRVIMALGEDGESFEVTIDPQAHQAFQQRLDADNRVAQRILNPQKGKYDVYADVGPAYATKREEAFNAFTLILTQAPQLAAIIGDLLLKAGDFPMSDEAAQRLKRMVPPQALGQGPTQAEQQLGQQLQQLQQLYAKSLEHNANDKLKLKGHAEKRDVEIFNAVTQRLKLLVDHNQFTQDQVFQVVRDAIKESQTADQALQSDANETQSQLGPAAHQSPANAAEDPLGTAAALLKPALSGEYLKIRHTVHPGDVTQAFLGGGEAPMKGARKSPLDGNWYVQHPVTGQHFRVDKAT